MNMQSVARFLAAVLLGVAICVSADAAALRHETSGEAFRDCPECPAMVVVPAGSFAMGAAKGEPPMFMKEGPQHEVHIRSFAAGKYDVTRGEWAQFASSTRRKTPQGCDWSPDMKGAPDASWKKLGFPQDDRHPVVCVSWNDAQDYVQWLSARTGRHYRLLTEAEWEYAARAGSATAFPWGATADHEHANYGAEECCSPVVSGRDQWKYTSPSGAFPANAFGLHDMHGNVLQWVQDCLSPSYEGVPADGSAYAGDTTLTDMPNDFDDLNGLRSCSMHILRGSDWNDPPEMVRSAFRNFGPIPEFPSGRSGGIGLRLAAD